MPTTTVQTQPTDRPPQRDGAIAALYDWQAHWSAAHPHRFVVDPGALADTILRAAGAGTMLDVGCGDGSLVHALLLRGVDARGVDASAAAVARASAITPHRFTVGDACALPFPDGAFRTVTSTFCLDTMTPEGVTAALREFRRIATHAVFITVRPRSDDAGIVRTVGDRAAWEARLFEAGFRRHPLLQRVTSFAALESEGDAMTLLAQPLADEIIAKYPPGWLMANRLLHTDMLRESGRRSDAHIARYTLACEHVRPNDVVLDGACGLGYGALILASGSEASRVIGVDNSPTAVGYARDILAGTGVRAEFHEADAAKLAFLPDESVDLVVSFETLEHVPDPAGLLAEFRRVLTPGGRIIVSVPNNWADESGKDPNPHHLHVYTWDRLAAQLSQEFLPERRWRQVAGGGPKLSDQPRQLDETPLGPPFDAPATGATPGEPEAEWWLALAMKSPLGASKATYRETIFPYYPPGTITGADESGPEGFHLSAFARDYDNPWLFRSLICIGPRMSHDAQRERIAREVITSARAGSPDRGGAICVLAYNVLASPSPGRIDEALGLIEDFDAAADGTPHAWRWRISNRYVAGRLQLLRGDRAAARAEFMRCGGMDVMRFSPLLATKTIDAFRHAGVISVADGDMTAARDSFRRGLEESRRVVQGSWVNIWGTPDRPQPYGMHEISQVMDLGSRCASWLGVLDRATTQPGQAWLLAQRQSFAEMLSWTQSLQRNSRWLEQQRSNWERIANERLTEIDRVRSWTEELGRAMAWRDDEIAKLRDQVRTLEAWNAELNKAKSWHEEQRGIWEATAARHAAQVAETARWHEAQRAAMEKTNAELTSQLEQTRGWAQKLNQATTWQQEQRQSLERTLAEVRTELKKSCAWAEELAAAVRLHQDERAAADRRADAAAAEFEKARGWADELAAAVKWHEEQRAETDRRLAAVTAELEKARGWANELASAAKWQEDQRRTWEQTAARHARALEEATRWANELASAAKWQEDQRKAWEQTAARHARALEEATSRANEMRDANDRLTGQLASLTTRLAETQTARQELETRLTETESRIAAISLQLKKNEDFRNMIEAEKSRLSAELGRVTSLPVHRFAMERWRNRKDHRPPDETAPQPPPPTGS